jgi:hypothetical protein
MAAPPSVRGTRGHAEQHNELRAEAEFRDVQRLEACGRHLAEGGSFIQAHPSRTSSSVLYIFKIYANPK